MCQILYLNIHSHFLLQIYAGILTRFWVDGLFFLFLVQEKQRQMEQMNGGQMTECQQVAQFQGIEQEAQCVHSKIIK